jgi:RNA polymerase sigma-70 factor, ECF subfamily
LHLNMLDLSLIADEQLVERVANGDASALEALYDRYVRQCFGLALRIVEEPALAEEVVQEVFTKFWVMPANYSPAKGKFASWLLSLVHHRCIDELRRKSRTTVSLEHPDVGSVSLEHPDVGSVLDRAPSKEIDPADRAVMTEEQAIVREALNEIAPNQRQVIEMAYFKGLSQSEIALRLDQPLGTVKTRTRQGLKQLRGLLVAKGLLTE